MSTPNELLLSSQVLVQPNPSTKWPGIQYFSSPARNQHTTINITPIVRNLIAPTCLTSVRYLLPVYLSLSGASELVSRPRNQVTVKAPCDTLPSSILRG